MAISLTHVGKSPAHILVKLRDRLEATTDYQRKLHVVECVSSFVIVIVFSCWHLEKQRLNACEGHTSCLTG